jgi:hypothetical protein
MTRSTCLHFLSDGTVCGLYSEIIDLRCLGPLTVTRASTIEFDHVSQLWQVYEVHGRCVYSAPSRNECVEWEHNYFMTQQEP